MNKSLIKRQCIQAIERVETDEYYKAAFCLKCGAFDSAKINRPLRRLCEHNGVYDKENGPIVYKVRNGVDQIRPIEILLDEVSFGETEQ